MHFWHNYHRSDALHFSLPPFRGTWFQCILLPIMFTLSTWLRLSTVRSLFFPLVSLGTPFSFGMDPNTLHQAAHLWTPSSPRNGQPSHRLQALTPHTGPLPCVDVLLTLPGSWHPCQAFAPHRRPLLSCYGSAEGFREALVIHLGSSTLWQVMPVAGHPPFGLRHPMLGPPPPQTPAHTS